MRKALYLFISLLLLASDTATRGVSGCLVVERSMENVNTTQKIPGRVVHLGV